MFQACSTVIGAQSDKGWDLGRANRNMYGNKEKCNCKLYK